MLLSYDNSHTSSNTLQHTAIVPVCNLCFLPSTNGNSSSWSSLGLEGEAYEEHISFSPSDRLVRTLLVFKVFTFLLPKSSITVA